MGLTRIFAGAVLGVLIPTAIALYFAFAPANTASAEARACQVAQSFVAEKVAPAKVVGFLPCSDNKGIQLKGGDWQFLGDVEIDKGAGNTEHESYLVRLKLGEDGAGTLETLTLR
jgi:hypothetical protein